MKEELEKLGFVYNINFNIYRIEILYDIVLFVNDKKEVKIFRKNEIMTLFPYNHEKIKQLIKLLS